MIEDSFNLKGKIEELIDSGSISLPDDSVNAQVYRMSIKEDMLEPDKRHAYDDEKAPKLGEEWIVYGSNACKKRQDRATPLR